MELLRLWNSLYLFVFYLLIIKRPFVNGDPLFVNLLHSIDGSAGNDFTGLLTDEKVGTGATFDYRQTQRPEWVGYNLLSVGLPANPLICDERYYNNYEYKNC